MLKNFAAYSLFLCTMLAAPLLLAQQPSTEESKEPQAIDLSPLTELGNDYQNSIKLLQNRFRIDHHVDEITMIFFRQYGSIPIVLVRPDGSKIFSGQAEEEGVFWFDASTYDMISIKNPMPGPWQAVGQVLPQSRVMVLSDLRLHAKPLPQMVFSGEILKQTAYLTNGDKPIDYAQFRDVVTLLVDFVSTNNPNYENFAADLQEVAEFVDDGMGMDETPLDGVFTGQFNLAAVPGEWTPVFKVQTPMFTREQVDKPIILYPNPIKITVQLDGGGEGYHKLLIDAQREHVDINSLLIDGKIRFPNGDIQTFSITEPAAEAREFLVVNYEYGVFRVNLTAYGKTVDGRNFILEVPEYSFLSEPPELQEADFVVIDPDTGEPVGQQSQAQSAAEQEADQQAIAAQSAAEATAEMSTATLMAWIVSLNLGLVIVGMGLIGFLFARNSKQAKGGGDKKPLLSKIMAILKFGKKPA